MDRKPKKSLHSRNIVKKQEKLIIDLVKLMPDYIDLKNDKYLLLWVGCVLLDVKEKHFEELSPIDSIVSIYNILFNLSTDELIKKKEDVTYELNEGRIRRRTLVKRIKVFLIDFFLKQVGLKAQTLSAQL